MAATADKKAENTGPAGAGASTQDQAEKQKSRERPYVVLEKLAPDAEIPADAELYMVRARDVTAAKDTEAIGKTIGEDDDGGPFVAVSRFNERKPKTETRVRRSWA
jgi:hypothetical protein